MYKDAVCNFGNLCAVLTGASRFGQRGDLGEKESFDDGGAKYFEPEVRT